MAVDCFDLLTSGEILTGITCTWTNILPDGWFYAIMLFAFEIMLFIKLDNMVAPAIMGVFLSVLMIALLPPSTMTVVIFVLAINLGVVVYNSVVRE